MPDHTMRSLVAPAPLPALVAAVALALSVSGCSTSGSAVDPLAQAAEATSHAGGGHVSLTIRVDVPGAPAPFAVSGEGLFNSGTREGAFSLQIAGPTAALPTGLGSRRLRIDGIVKSSTLYVGSPLLSKRLPGGARWMKIDLTRFGRALGVNLQRLTGQSDPARLLQYLKAGEGAVTTVGPERVRGVPTTHYSTDVDLSKAADMLPASTGAQLRASLSKLTTSTGLRLPVDLWVDDRQLVRRITIALSLPVFSQKLQMHLTLELFGFGPTPAVSVPPRDEVYDATQQALTGIGKNGL